MRWPGDHPLVQDDALRQWSDPAGDLCGEARFLTILRYLPGRRVVSLVQRPQGLAVLKVFASPRARGNDRRLVRLATTPAAGIVPRSLGTDPSGHVHLISYRPGLVLHQQPDDQFVPGANATGRLLRRLHECGAVLDRSWTWQDELRQLAKQAPSSTADLVTELTASVSNLDGGDLVCAHRDCHPKQVVLDHAGNAEWIDLDDCAMAPRALDLGNMLAHLRSELLSGARTAAVTGAAERAFLQGYGPTPDVSADMLRDWQAVASLRLAGLAATRRAEPGLHDRLLGEYRQPISSHQDRGQARHERRVRWTASTRTPT